MYRTLALTLAALVALAGCITLPDEALDRTDAATASTPLPPQTQGSMSARESAEESTRMCIDRGISLPDPALRCAQRVTTVEGEMDLRSLPASLTTSFADVEVLAGEEGEWSLVLVVERAAATDEEARRGLDQVRLVWSHETPSGYALEARVETDDEVDNVNVDLFLTVPRSLLVGLTVGTSSGDVLVEGLELRGAGIASSSGDVRVAGSTGDSLYVGTSSGDIELVKLTLASLTVQSSSGDVEMDVEADVVSGSSSSGDWSFDVRSRNVAIGSTSGDISGLLAPAGVSTFTLSSTSGDVGIGVPTGAKYGYRVSAETTSGDAGIDLPDGEASCDEDGEQCSFATDGFATRANRAVVTVSTTSGDASVESSN